MYYTIWLRRTCRRQLKYLLYSMYIQNSDVWTILGSSCRLQIYTVELQWNKWLKTHASGSFHFLFFVFSQSNQKFKKSAVLFVYFLYKNSTFCLKMTADFLVKVTKNKKNEKWNEPNNGKTVYQRLQFSMCLTHWNYIYSTVIPRHKFAV